MTRISRFAHEAMTTVFEIVIAGKSAGYAGQAARAAFDEIDRLEGLFSRFDPSSEISRLGRLAPGGAMRIGVETAEVLRLAADIEEATGGAFSVARPAGFDGREEGTAGRPGQSGKTGRRLPLNDLLSITARQGAFEAVRTAPAKGDHSSGERGRRPAAKTGGCANARTAPTPHTPQTPATTPALTIDLGGIGKGYALDAAAGILKDWGVWNALLHSGTSTVLGIGPGPEGLSSGGPGWPVGLSLGAVDDPDAPRRTIYLNERAVSGSGPEVKGRHIYDPRTGLASRGKLLALASHPVAAVSDAMSTAFFVLDQAGIERCCRCFPEVWAVVITPRKKCRMFNICLG